MIVLWYDRVVGVSPFFFLRFRSVSWSHPDYQQHTGCAHYGRFTCLLQNRDETQVPVAAPAQLLSSVRRSSTLGPHTASKYRYQCVFPHLNCGSIKSAKKTKKTTTLGENKHIIFISGGVVFFFPLCKCEDQHSYGTICSTITKMNLEHKWAPFTPAIEMFPLHSDRS